MNGPDGALDGVSLPGYPDLGTHSLPDQ